MTVGVSIRGLVKRYGDAVAVDEISLDVAPGEFVTLLGPSGCGKTTTLRSIAGLEQPNAGTITIGDQTVFGDGHDVPVHRRRLGMVFQSYAVWPHMTVAENVRFPLRMLKEPRSKHRAIVAETLERVGLADFAKRYPGELSGGQQQRVALARALACNPAVILYDEPLSNLDAALREQMRFEL
ncbi:MAG: ABC transporter ATP-binding protein, partial [Micromonosporaceae bacterium]